MDELPKLWLVKKRQERYWFYVGEPQCESCNKETMTGFHFVNWSKKDFVESFLCDECARQHMNYNTNMQEYKRVLLCSEPPTNSIPVELQFPGLTPSRNMSAFEAAVKNIGGETIIDKTRLSGRTTQPSQIEETKERVFLETTKQTDDILDFHLTAEPTKETTKKIGGTHDEQTN